MKARSALVLGATGRVGRPLCRTLVESGWRVHAVARCRDVNAVASLQKLGLDPIAFDVTHDDPRALPDVNVVLLEIWDPTQSDLIWPINFHGVGRVVERYAGIADIVNGCTINVYGCGPDAPDETTPPRPDTEYGRSRFAQEKLIDYFCARGGTRGIHVRYAHSNAATWGLVYRTACSVRDHKSLGPDPDQRLRVIAVEDFVRVTEAAIDRAAKPPVAVNCTHPQVWTRRELADELQRRLGCGRVIFDREQGGQENSVYADPTRMIEWFGPPQVSTDEILKRVVRRLRDFE